MEYKLGLYEKSMPNDWSFAQKLSMTAACGFDQLEISIDESEEKLARLTDVDATSRELLCAMAQSGTPVRTMCLSGHRRFPFGSHDAETRRRSLAIMRRAIELSAQTGIRIIQLAGYDVYYEDSDESTKQYFLETLARASELAASAAVILAFETMETPFMDTVQKAMHAVQHIGSPYLGIYPDIGNLKNAAVLYHTDVVEDLALGSGHIFAAHFKETLPGVYRDMDFASGGHTEYERCAQELWRQGVRTFTGEFWHKEGQDTQRTIQNVAVFLRDKIEQAAKA